MWCALNSVNGRSLSPAAEVHPLCVCAVTSWCSYRSEMSSLIWIERTKRAQDLVSKACAGPVARRALAALMVSLTALGQAAEDASNLAKHSGAKNQDPRSETQLDSSCYVRDKRVCKVLDMVRAISPTRGIVWSEGSTSESSIRAEYEWALGSADVIHLGNTLDLTDSEIMFLVAHEIGHSVLRHGRAAVEFFAGEDRDLPDRELVRRYASRALRDVYKASSVVHQQEYDADEFAATVMLRYGHNPAEAMRTLLRVSFSSPTHPSKKMRIQRVSLFAENWHRTLAGAEQTNRPISR